MRSIEDRLDGGYPEPWKPKPGDKLVGVVVDLDERDSQYGDSSYPIVTVQPDDGTETAFHAFHTVARNELAKQRPQIGDRIGIAYHGMPEGKSYESYRIVVEHADPQANRIDWDKHRDPDESDQDAGVDDYDPKGPTDDDLPF